MSFPETVDEILDVSEDEGEGPELGRTPRGLLAELAPLPAALGMGTGVGGAAWPHRGLSERRWGAQQPPGMASLPCAV